VLGPVLNIHWAKCVKGPVTHWLAVWLWPLHASPAWLAAASGGSSGDCRNSRGCSNNCCYDNSQLAVTGALARRQDALRARYDFVVIVNIVFVYLHLFTHKN